jgi:hypothetical protein
MSVKARGQPGSRRRQKRSRDASRSPSPRAESRAMNKPISLQPDYIDDFRFS